MIPFDVRLEVLEAYAGQRGANCVDIQGRVTAFTTDVAGGKEILAVFPASRNPATVVPT